MRTLANTRRVRRSLLHAVETMELDLDGVTVLTEAASGPFVVTALAAALAGADQVIACTRDSRFGTADEVRDYTGAWAADLGVASRIDVRIGPAASAAPAAELVTNLGFVRPIDADFVAALPTGAAVSLMFETWEHRTSDVDLDACRGTAFRSSERVKPTNGCRSSATSVRWWCGCCSKPGSRCSVAGSSWSVRPRSDRGRQVDRGDGWRDAPG